MDDTSLDLDTQHIASWEDCIEGLISYDTLVLSHKELDIEKLDILSSVLKTHPEVRSLKITCCSPIQQLPENFLADTSITILSFSRTKIRSIENLAALDTLRMLDLSHTPISYLESLVKYPNLQNLNLIGTTVSSFSFLTSPIRKIYVPETIKDFQDFPKLDSIKSLTIDSEHITNLNGLPSLPKLSTLKILKSSITSLIGLPSLPKLRYLEMTHSVNTYLKSSPLLRNLKTKIIFDSKQDPEADTADLESIDGRSKTYYSQDDAGLEEDSDEGPVVLSQYSTERADIPKPPQQSVPSTLSPFSYSTQTQTPTTRQKPELDEHYQTQQDDDTLDSAPSQILPHTRTQTDTRTIPGARNTHTPVILDLLRLPTTKTSERIISPVEPRITERSMEASAPQALPLQAMGISLPAASVTTMPRLRRPSYHTPASGTLHPEIVAEIPLEPPTDRYYTS